VHLLPNAGILLILTPEIGILNSYLVADSNSWKSNSHCAINGNSQLQNTENTRSKWDRSRWKLENIVSPGVVGWRLHDTAQCRGAERGEAWDEVRELIPNRRFFAPLIHANQAFIIGMLEDESVIRQASQDCSICKYSNFLGLTHFETAP
jgi:hypothetical protein